MRTKPYTCQCCKTETRKATTVNSGHTLCNDCNLKLLDRGILYFNEDSGLKITGTHGDFKIVQAFTVVKPDYWETQREAREQAQMDNQSMVGWDVHESY